VLPAIGFGYLFGTGELAGGDAECGGQSADSARGRRGATGFKARNGQGVNARALRKFGLSKEAPQAKATKSLWKRQKSLANNRLRDQVLV
jgi:hypothetical protein